MKEDLETNFDDDLDIDFDDLDFGDDPFAEQPKPKNSREAIEGVLIDSSRGFVDTFKDTSKITLASDFVKNVMPDSLSSEVSSLVSIKDKLSDELNVVGKEVKLHAGKLFKATEKYLPKTGVMGKATDKLRSLLATDDHGKTGLSNEEIRNNLILEKVIASLGEKSDREKTTDLIQQSIQHKKDMTIMDLSAMQTTSLSRLDDFNTEITNAYFRKSLELQYKSLFVNKDLLEVTKVGFDTFKNQLEGIVKNTALPDIIKARAAEAIKVNMRQNMVNSAMGNLFASGGWGDNLKESLTQKIRGAGSNLVESLSGTVEGLDAAAGANEMMSELGVSKSELTGGEIAKFAKDKVTNIIGNKLSKTEIGASAVNNTKKMFLDPSEYFKDVAKNNKGIKSSLAGAISSLTSNTALEQTSVVEKDDLELATQFDGRAYSSITKVIPGLLSKIHAEVKSIRTGTEEEEERYDYTDDKFYSETESKNSIKEKLSTSMNQSGTTQYLDRLINALTKEGELELSAKETDTFRQGVVSYVASGKTVYPTSLEENGFYNYFSKDVADKVKKSVDAYLAPDDESLVPDRLETMQTTLVNTRDRLPNANNILREYNKSGRMNTLEDMGLVTFNKDKGTYVLDNDVYKQTLASASMSQDIGIDKVMDRPLVDKETLPTNLSNIGSTPLTITDSVSDTKTPVKVVKKYSNNVDYTKPVANDNNAQDIGVAKVTDGRLSRIPLVKGDNKSTYTPVVINESIAKKDLLVDTKDRVKNLLANSLSKEDISQITDDVKEQIMSNDKGHGSSVRDKLRGTANAAFSKVANRNNPNTEQSKTPETVSTKGKSKKGLLGGLLGKTIFDLIPGMSRPKSYKGLNQFQVAGKVMTDIPTALAKGGYKAGKYLGKKLFKKKDEPDGVLRKESKKKEEREKETKLLDKIGEKVSSVVNLNKEKKPKKNIFDRDGSGRRDGSWMDRLAKMGKKKDDSSKESILPKKMPETSMGMFGGMLGMLGGLFGIGKKMLGGILGSGKLMTGLISTMGTVATFLTTKLPSIFKGLFSFLGKGLGKKLFGGAAKTAVAATSAKVAGKAVTAKATEAIGKKIVTKTIAKKAAAKATTKVAEKIVAGKIAKKLGAKAAAKIAGKVAARALPFLGWGLAAWDAGNVAYDMVTNGTSFKSALSKQMLGMDITDDAVEEETISDKANEKINSTVMDTSLKKPANNTKFTKDVKEDIVNSDNIESTVSNTADERSATMKAVHKEKEPTKSDMSNVMTTLNNGVSPEVKMSVNNTTIMTKQSRIQTDSLDRLKSVDRTLLSSLDVQKNMLGMLKSIQNTNLKILEKEVVVTQPIAVNNTTPKTNTEPDNTMLPDPVIDLSRNFYNS